LRCAPRFRLEFLPDSAAQRSCGALRLAGDAVMTDTEAFCAALGKLQNPWA
jgi:hypothetical protein